MDLKALIGKYSQPGPRYTSYPTAPSWVDTQREEAYSSQLEKATDASKPLSLYFHIPFCESLCYYCGCNIKITKDHSRSRPYIESMLQELAAVHKNLGAPRKVQQIAWGGGTPTYLSIDEIKRLQEGTLALFELAPNAEVSVEIDPRVTTDAHLSMLREVGFNRVSLGVQDFNPEVQKAVNRIQSAEATERMIEQVRKMGYRFTNFDLIYGLPFQTLKTFETTVDQVAKIRPDRIALYNYAHLPSLIKHQSILDPMPRPSAKERVEIFSMAYGRLTEEGYKSIGMDHFALETDELFQAIASGKLYRNFQGYSVKKGSDLLGVGVSAIGQVGHSYFQNTKDIKEYQFAIENGRFATARGCLLTDDDLRRQWVIQSILCQFRLSPAEYEAYFGESFYDKFSLEWEQMKPFCDENILQKTFDGFQVTELGRLFVRNVAMVFDAYLKVKTGTFSRTV
jgi:oxygen-independent coproporphyrinogen III oxidase